MKILSVEQIREADRLTIEREPIASIDLMERAAAGITDRLTEIFDPNTPFTIYCGMGNNGGDGLAIARQLSSADYDVRVVVIQHRATGSSDFELSINEQARMRMEIKASFSDVDGASGMEIKEKETGFNSDEYRITVNDKAAPIIRTSVQHSDFNISWR